MFQLTRKEKQIAAFVLLMFLLGWSVQQFKTLSMFEKSTPLPEAHE